MIPLELTTYLPGEYSQTQTVFLELENQLAERKLIVSGTTLEATSEF